MLPDFVHKAGAKSSRNLGFYQRSKIIIVGGGIAGLSFYLQLRKRLPSFESHSVIIYESHEPRARLPTTTDQAGPSDTVNLEDLSASTAIVGGGIALSPNGVRVLTDLNPNIAAAAKRRGFVAEKYTFKTARGHTLVKQPTSDKKDPPEYTLAISRHALWQSLVEAVGGGVVRYRKVVDVDTKKSRPVVKFEDGEEEEADLVIGADGVRSAVKKGIFGEENDTVYAPRYEEFCGIGSFVTMDVPQELIDDKSMVFSFGATGFFGYAACEDPSHRKVMWWSNWEAPSVLDRKAIDVSDIQKQLQERHGNWVDPIVQDVIKSANVDSIYPIWTIPDLPHWGENGAILIGDAAHAMSPTTGQGSSQALEDSLTLALLLTHYLEKVQESNNTPGNDNALSFSDAITLSAKGLYEIRKPRVGRIKARGHTLQKSKGSVNIVMEYFFYGFMWLLTNVPAIAKLIIGDVTKDLYGWNAEEEVKKFIEKQTSL